MPIEICDADNGRGNMIAGRGMVSGTGLLEMLIDRDVWQTRVFRSREDETQ